jgi:hypothetical protein
VGLVHWRRIVIACGVAAAAAWLWLHSEHAGRPGVCPLCLRPVHSGAAVEAEVEGRRRTLCCAGCVRAAHRQTGRPVKILQFTDFESGRSLRPEETFLVRGSDVNLCTRREPLVDVSKHVFEEHYDRCSPSFLAFASRERAEAFARRNGGTVVPAARLAAELGGAVAAAP